MSRLGEDGDHEDLQHFLADSPWDARLIQRAVAERVCPMIGVQAWVIDDTGIPKDGKHSPGVKHQYSGTLGVVTDKEGQHSTDMIDLQFVLEGTVVLRLDSGEEKAVPAGSLIVQNATSHQWLNQHESEWVKILSIFVGAERA